MFNGTKTFLIFSFLLVFIASSCSYSREDFIEEMKQTKDFHGRNLKDIQLFDLNLDGIDFSNANLSGANFYNTQGYNVNFQNADLRGANFQSSYIEGDFTGADLEGVKNLIQHSNDTSGNEATPELTD